MTTTIGYGALLVAANRALISFGQLAMLGEIACLTTAVAFFPARRAAGVDPLIALRSD